jgi:hypothetical protein
MTERINLFYKKGSSKAENDAENKIRENVLVFLENELPPEYAADEKWRSLYTKLHETLRTLCPTEYAHVKIVKKGGRKFNYDFDVIYLDSNNTKVHSIKLEFKHNSSKLEKIPQILSLMDNVGLIDAPSYSEHYYTLYLDAYLAEIAYTGEKPTLEEYISLVSGIVPEKHPMFMFMRAANPNTAVANIIKESIHTYLNTYVSKFKVDEFTKKLVESQSNKYFLLWDLSRFHIDSFSIEDLSIKHINLYIRTFKKTSNLTKKQTNTIIALSTTSEYHLLLRWRNHNGILNPAWQIKVTRKSGK